MDTKNWTVIGRVGNHFQYRVQTAASMLTRMMDVGFARFLEAYPEAPEMQSIDRSKLFQSTGFFTFCEEWGRIYVEDEHRTKIWTRYSINRDGIVRSDFNGIWLTSSIRHHPAICVGHNRIEFNSRTIANKAFQTKTPIAFVPYSMQSITVFGTGGCNDSCMDADMADEMLHAPVYSI